MTVRNPSFPHPMQMGFRKHLGAQMASFILTETIQYYRESSTDIYIAFLDNEKAFDRVWLDGLLFKLSKIGITGKPWRILRNMYYNMYSCVSYAGHKSPPFKVLQGVGQGRVLSAWLFLVYINDLLTELENSRCGLKLPGINIPGLLLADDTTLLATTPRSLQNALNTVSSYAKTWRLMYNASKSNVIIFTTKRKIHTQHRYYLNVDTIPVCDSVIYAGIMLTCTNSSKELAERACDKMRKTVAANYKLGLKYGGLNPMSCSTIWTRVILPSALFGCESWGALLRGKDIADLEITQRKFCRKIQGLDRNSPTPITCASMNITDIESYIDKSSLLLFGKLCSMDCDYGL